MPGNESDRPGLTVGSLLGAPLGSTEGAAPAGPSPATGALTDDEGPWTVAGGQLEPASTQAPFGARAQETLTYDNVFGQPIEQVWFDGKVVYALDLGEVDVDPYRVKVAQEYQIVFAVELDEHGHPTAEPERVPDQLNIYDSVPGLDKYSPIWQFNYVVVPRDYRPNTLRSERDCVSSGYPIRRSQVFEN